MNCKTALTFVFGFAALVGATGPFVVRGAEAASSEPPRLCLGGTTFVLASHSEDEALETDVFLPEGEGFGSWGRMVTAQRLLKEASADRLLEYLRSKIVSRPLGEFAVLRQSSYACVFEAKVPESEEGREHRVVGLIIASPQAPALLNVVQYAYKPALLEQAVAEMDFASWKGRLLRQADERTRLASSGAPGTSRLPDKEGMKSR